MTTYPASTIIAIRHTVAKQKDAEKLKEELEELGLKAVLVTEDMYIEVLPTM